MTFTTTMAMLASEMIIQMEIDAVVALATETRTRLQTTAHDDANQFMTMGWRSINKLHRMNQAHLVL